MINHSIEARVLDVLVALCKNVEFCKKELSRIIENYRIYLRIWQFFFFILWIRYLITADNREEDEAEKRFVLER